MIKQAKFTFNKGMNQDLSKSKHPGDFYYEGNAIRIINTDSQSLYSVENEKGNELVLSIPSPIINSNTNSIDYNNKKLLFINNPNNELLNSDLPLISGNQIIIGHTITRNSIILLTTDNDGFDCIWEVNNVLGDSYDLTLLYCRNLSFTTDNPIQVLYNYENEKIQKIYWVDGENQLRFLNIRHSIKNGDAEELIDLPSNLINIVGNYELSQPILDSVIGGGIHTSGIIQYAYNLYNSNGSQTSISPFSTLINLDKGVSNGGGEVNEIVGTTPNLIIPKLDINYNNIRIYAIKYTSFNEIPSINLIEDNPITTYENYTFSDTGNNISSLTLSEFLFLGSNPLIPSHIESKDNRLFAASYKDSSYKLEIDCRAYSHDTNGSTKLFTGNVQYAGTSLQGGYSKTFLTSDLVSTYNSYPLYEDAINPNYDLYKYQKDGLTLGGEGLFIKYELTKTNKNDIQSDIKDVKVFKDNEIYRIGIQFYNKLGQYTEVKWIADFKSPIGNLEDTLNCLTVELKLSEFNNYINSLNLSDINKPVGYKIVRAERNIADKTILCQGALTGMMVQTKEKDRNIEYWYIKGNRKKQSSKEVKMPLAISRGFVNLANELSIHPSEHLKGMFEGRAEANHEIYRDFDRDYKTQHAWQYNKMMQIHSPDILFNTGLVFTNGLSLYPKGLVTHTTTNIRTQRIRVSTNTPVIDKTLYDIDNLFIKRSNVGFGLIGPEQSRTLNATSSTIYNRQYLGYRNFNVNTTYPIYGKPEIAERGQGSTPYNGDNKFRYINTLEGLITDGREEQAGDGIDSDLPPLTSVNCQGERCGVIVEGTSNMTEENRKSLEDFLPNPTFIDNGLILAEIKRPLSYIYNGNIYGGLSIIDKTRTSYIEIGVYKDINDNINYIESPGDTFVQVFRVGRTLKSDTEILNNTTILFSEIMEFNVESSINLKNRNDLSIFSWDNKFQPKYDEYHKYNRVYSQESNLIRRTTDPLLLKDINNFDTRIISSKLKVPNETIDSWTDFLENETLNLDGKYGAINSLVNVRDEIFALQDSAISKIAINPRIQTQGSDGISIELGRGSILYDYNYITTQSGTVNKWSVTKSPNNFYYLDAINKSMGKVSLNEGAINLSDKHGFHAHFLNNTDYNIIKNDNPILKTGVSSGYDITNGDVYMTLLQNDKSFTIRFNEKNNAFHSFEPYYPSIYINKGNKLFLSDSTNNKLYQHYLGEYNKFFEEYHPSYITLLINPETDLDCTFNNIDYKSEVYINDIDQPNSTLTHISAWNEYQNTGRVQLVLGRNKNLRRKFRNWNALISRNQGSRDRMRNPWLFLKLEFDKNDNSKLILHDIIINYNI